MVVVARGVVVAVVCMAIVVTIETAIKTVTSSLSGHMVL